MNYQEKSFYERNFYINNNSQKKDYTDICIKGANKLDEMHQSLNEITQKTTSGFKTATQARNSIINESVSTSSNFNSYSNRISTNKPVEKRNNNFGIIHSQNDNLANKRSQLANMNSLSNKTVL